MTFDTRVVLRHVKSEMWGSLLHGQGETLILFRTKRNHLERLRKHLETPPCGGRSKPRGSSSPSLRTGLLPYSLHNTHYTLHPAPYTHHPTPYTLHPTPSTLHSTPYTLTLHSIPKSKTLKPQTSTLNPQTSTLNPQPSTLTPALQTLNPKP